MLFLKNSLQKLLVLSCILSFFYNCSKDDIDTEITDENGIVTNPLPNPDPSQNAEKAAAIALYNTYYLPSKTSTNDPEWSGDIATCNAGTASKVVRDKILMRIHYFRKAVGLNNTLIEDPNKSLLAMEAALMMHSNSSKGLSHTPTNDWNCYSEQGKQGAGASLLSSVHNSETIDLYIKDPGNNNAHVGHRRWLQYTKLNEIGIGNTSSYNAIHVIGGSATAPADAPEFISWPPKGYVPSKLVYPRWSFSYPNANFENAEITMTATDGASINLSVNEYKGNRGDNTIVWEPTAIDTNIITDTRYTVTIDNVSIDNDFKKFSYDVIMFVMD